jgi:hypothetical protein
MTIASRRRGSLPRGFLVNRFDQPEVRMTAGDEKMTARTMAARASLIGTPAEQPLRHVQREPARA